MTLQDPVVCVVGATGMVGSQLLDLIDQRNFPIGELRLLSSSKSAGKVIPFRGESLTVRQLDASAFEGADLVFFAATGALSRKFAPLAVAAGAVVLDKSGSWRLENNVPLVVPEINADQLQNHNGIIAVPNCSVTGFAMAIDAINKVTKVLDVVVTTFQSASGAGLPGIEQLANGADAPVFPGTLLGNVLPQCETFLDNGFTTEEEKMLYETRKILGDDQLKVTMTCTRVPVEVGHSSAMLLTTSEPITLEQARDAMRNYPGIDLLDDTRNSVYPTPESVRGEDHVQVGRLRLDHDGKRLWMWQVTDNLRKGAALNSIQIAEQLLAVQLSR